MPKRPYDLPSMSALVCFEAAARHESFKKAASELNVTPAAVSHQVKALEKDLQRILFIRNHRGVELSETGAYLYLAVQRGFEGMSETISQLRSQEQQEAVTIQSTLDFSALWLTPMLAQFGAEHKGVQVAQIIRDEARADVYRDISVHYGDPAIETGEVGSLFRDEIIALASPALIEKHGLAATEDLARAPLIHFTSIEPSWSDWESWSRQVGYDGPLGPGFRVNNYLIAVNAAQDSIGVVLGWSVLTARLQAMGLLKQVAPAATPAPAEFYLKLQNPTSDKARRVFQWLLAAAQSEAREISAPPP